MVTIHVQIKRGYGTHDDLMFQDSLAEWSKAPASGASPQGRGFEPHSCHSFIIHRTLLTSKKKSCIEQLQLSLLALIFKTVWPSGLRRWLQAPVRKGVGSSPTAVINNRALRQHV